MLEPCADLTDKPPHRIIRGCNLHDRQAFWR
jgi:hypothetical protein